MLPVISSVSALFRARKSCALPQNFSIDCVPALCCLTCGALPGPRLEFGLAHEAAKPGSNCGDRGAPRRPFSLPWPQVEDGRPVLRVFIPDAMRITALW